MTQNLLSFYGIAIFVVRKKYLKDSFFEYE